MKLIPLLAMVVMMTGCTSMSKLAHELKNDGATVEIFTPFGTFKRSMPNGTTGAGATIIKTNVTVPLTVPVILQVNQ